MASFSRQPIEMNQWKAEVCGVDMTDRLLKALGDIAANGGEIWTAWVTLDEQEEPPMPAVTYQLTQENCQTVQSHIDDEADAILVQDPRDGLFFRYMRCNTDPEVYEYVFQTVHPWSTQIVSLVPMEQSYQPYIDQITKSFPDDFNLEDWDEARD